MKKYKVFKFKNDFYCNGITYKKGDLIKECEDIGRIAYRTQNGRYFSKTFIENNYHYLFEEVKEEEKEVTLTEAEDEEILCKKLVKRINQDTGTKYTEAKRIISLDGKRYCISIVPI